MKSRILTVIALAALVAGCSKLTKENYDALEVGMKKADVEAVLGGADTCSESMGTDSCVWGDEEGKHIKVRFIADAAVTFSNEGL